MEDAGLILTSLFCGCWIAPFIALSTIYLIYQSIRHTWEMRGIERGGMYCANCRFDVRGATGECCPECGAFLLEPANTSLPRGGIIIEGVDPPMGLGPTIILYLIGWFAPTVALVILLGMLLPFNYNRSTWLTLDSYVFGQDKTVSFSIESQSGLFGRQEFVSLRNWELSYEVLDQFANASPRDESAAAEVWDHLVGTRGARIPESKSDAMRREFAAILVAACELDEDRAHDQLRYFSMGWERNDDINFHPLYTVLCFFMVVAAMIFFIHRALRSYEKSFAQHAKRVDGVIARYKKMIDKTSVELPD